MAALLYLRPALCCRCYCGSVCRSAAELGISEHAGSCGTAAQQLLGLRVTCSPFAEAKGKVLSAAWGQDFLQRSVYFGGTGLGPVCAQGKGPTCFRRCQQKKKHAAQGPTSPPVGTSPAHPSQQLQGWAHQQLPCMQHMVLGAPLQGIFLPVHAVEQSWRTEAFLTLSILDLWERNKNKQGFGTSNTSVYLHMHTIGRVLTHAEWEQNVAVPLPNPASKGKARRALLIHTSEGAASTVGAFLPLLTPTQPGGSSGVLRQSCSTPHLAAAMLLPVSHTGAPEWAGREKTQSKVCAESPWLHSASETGPLSLHGCECISSSSRAALLGCP